MHLNKTAPGNSGQIRAVPSQNLNPGILMMQPAGQQERAHYLGTAHARRRRVDLMLRRGRESSDAALRPSERRQSPDLQSTRQSQLGNSLNCGCLSEMSYQGALEPTNM